MAVEEAINHMDILQGADLLNTLSEAVSVKKAGIMTYLNGGKWQVMRVGILNCTDQCVVVESQTGDKKATEQLRVNQPVGMSFQIDFVKYIFESTISGLESSISSGSNGRILIELPEKMQKIQRRAYQRQPVPKEMNVKVLFWHRGYLDSIQKVPADHYWQGELVDLSAGGIRVTIELDKQDCFTIGQIIGIQFTPMCYQRPILVEGHLRYMSEDPAGVLYLGIEFLGLEASIEGRQILQRLLDTVEEYQKINKQAGEESANDDPVSCPEFSEI